MTHYGQIPTHLICRFAELSKPEIVVISFLYASRNRKTGQCNPSRATIARATGIGRSHVTEAMQKLTARAWLKEKPDGHFDLNEDPPTAGPVIQPKLVFVPKYGTNDVPDSGTNKAENVPEYGTQLFPNTEQPETPNVPKYGTNCSRIRNTVFPNTEHPYKDSFLTENLTEDLTEKKKGEDVENSAPSKPTRQRTPKTRDERADHPAIKFVHETMSIYPHKDLWNRIIRELGEDFNPDHLRTSYEVWRSVNGNKLNLESWLFTPHKTGELPPVYISPNQARSLTNGSGNHRPTSEREKSAQRRANGDRIADEMELRANAEIARRSAISSQDDPHRE